MNSWENLQILPLENVGVFHRIRKNGAPLSENVDLFHRIRINLYVSPKSSDFRKKNKKWDSQRGAFLNFLPESHVGLVSD